MPISEAQVRTAKSATKAFKLYDSDGLFLLITPSGGKLWRLRFRFDGKEKLLTLGAYPKVGLAAARKKRNAAIEEAVEARGVLETNRRLKQYCSAIFRFGIASQYCEHDAAAR